MNSTQRVLPTRERYRRCAVRSAALAALMILSACMWRKPAADSGGPVAMTYTIPVTVESRFREDLTLFVLHDGMASRLTRIGSSGTTKFVIPAHLVGSLGELTLLVEGVGARSGMSDRFTTGRLRVLPGQGIVWTLETRLERSFAQVVPAGVIVPDSTPQAAAP
jgi:hypothetical protein